MRTIFKGPVLTASGYGVHARQLLKALIDSGKHDVTVVPLRWGETSYIGIEESSWINEFVKNPEGKYDLSVQVTIPNEFERIAAFNIGVTAGIEVDRVSPSWIEKTNKNVDAVIVPSKHSAETFAKIIYQDEKGGKLRLDKQLAILPESFDETVFNTNKIEYNHFEHDFVDMPEFNFISVGLGLDKGNGEDRKNFSNLIRWFCEKFKGNDSVGLILKLSVMGTSNVDYEVTSSRIKMIKESTGCGEFPKIKLVHGRLSDEQMASLYKHNKVKAYVTLTHGEGYGLPILEAAACGLPVIATNWSGHLDFLNIDGRNLFVPVEYDLAQIPQSAIWQGVMEPGTRWANPKQDDAKHKMSKVLHSYDVPKQWATELAISLSNTHTSKKLGPDFIQLIEHFMDQTGVLSPKNEKEMVEHVRKQLGIEKGTKTIIYTMPMSAGDVYCSTSVVNSIKKKYPDHLVFFATGEKYASILKDNPNIHKVIRFEEWMTNVPLLEQIFTRVFTPNLAIQLTTSNWVKGGKGRLLAHEMAHQCDVELDYEDGYFISLKDPGLKLPENFVCFNPGPMKGQWESRTYNRWQEVINNIKDMTGFSVVQIGQQDDPAFDNVLDLRGKTKDYNELAFVISKSKVMLGIDTATMHIAAGLSVPVVSIFGSSYSTSTGPAISKSLTVLLDAPNRGGCEKACYKNQCIINKDNPCVNEITPKTIVKGVIDILKEDSKLSVDKVDDLLNTYKEYRPKIFGYTHILNPKKQGFPFIQSIKSMLGFCEQVVVVDGGSTDGSLDEIKLINDSRIKVVDHEWDWDEPGMDGMQKAYGRAMVDAGPGDFLWQQDADEIVHEDDYQKIKDLVLNFPRHVDVIHLPIIELWSDNRTVRTDRHSWKWRLSRNDFKITHGINKDARLTNNKTGRVYAKKGQSDGCEYIDIMTNEFLPHAGFYTQELETLRRNNPQAYGKVMNEVFSKLPSVFHYSWCDLERKVRNFRDFWDKCWSKLYGEENPIPRFPDVKSDEDVKIKAEELRLRGGEHSKAETFKLDKNPPSIMKD